MTQQSYALSVDGNESSLVDCGSIERAALAAIAAIRLGCSTVTLVHVVGDGTDLTFVPIVTVRPPAEPKGGTRPVTPAGASA